MLQTFKSEKDFAAFFFHYPFIFPLLKQVLVSQDTLSMGFVYHFTHHEAVQHD